MEKCSYGLSSTVRVDQGHIESSRRGCIYIQKNMENGRPFLGVKVDVLTEGSIISEKVY